MVNKSVKELLELLCQAIKHKSLITFYYESKSSGKKEWRIIEPYFVAINARGNLILVGLPLEERSKYVDKRITPHYLIEKIDLKKLEVCKKNILNPK